MWVAFAFISFCFHSAFSLNLANSEVQSSGIIFAILLKKSPYRYLS